MDRPKTGLGLVGEVPAKYPTWTLIGLVVLAAFIVFTVQPGVIQLRPLSIQDFAELLAPAFAAALFVERVVEVFTSIARGAESRQHRAVTEAAVELAAKEGATGEHRDAALVASRNLAAFQAETQYITLAAGVALGLVLSVLGIRILEQFVVAASLAGAPEAQQSAFQAFDAIVTGGIIGGGADGLHKLVSVFTTKFDQLSDANRRG